MLFCFVLFCDIVKHLNLNDIKKLTLLLIAVFLYSFLTFAGTYTVYGKNEGNIVITQPGPNGTTTSTTINCNKWYNYVCYSWPDNPLPVNNPGGPIHKQYGVLIANDEENPIKIEGFLESYNMEELDTRRTLHEFITFNVK